MTGTYIKALFAPEYFEWEDEGDTEAGSMSDGHIPRQLKFRLVDNGVAAIFLNERNSKPHFKAPQLY